MVISFTSFTQFSGLCIIDLSRKDKVFWKVTKAEPMAALILSDGCTNPD